MIDGFVRLMNSPDDFTGPVNLGNPVEFTILELAEKAITMTGSDAKITFKPLPSDDPKQRQPDITLAKGKLGWEPKIKLDEGLVKTIEYFRELSNRKSQERYRKWDASILKSESVNA
jgi:UDP-glucuronate decarboxylase